MPEKIAMRREWPDFSTYLGTVICKGGAHIKMAVTYKGETREILMTCDEFARKTGFDEARRLMPNKPTKRRGITHLTPSEAK